jgi:prepilin-type N-terminal cleavage/methylation domain-containing protein
MAGLCRKAFTLVELLIVIAVIAILAGMLLPAFKRAREAARKTVCLSNQKQIGLGLMMYTPDFGDWTPQGLWSKAADDYWTANGIDATQGIPYKSNALKYLYEFYTSKTKELYICPTPQPGAWHSSYVVTPSNPFDGLRCYYGVNSHDKNRNRGSVFGFWDHYGNYSSATAKSLVMIRFSKIPTPSRMPAVADAGGPGSTGLWQAHMGLQRGSHYNSYNRMSYKHAGLTNFLVADGHCESRPWEEVQQPSKSSGSGTGWNWWGAPTGGW